MFIIKLLFIILLLYLLIDILFDSVIQNNKETWIKLKNKYNIH